jgi:hypothetical protein
VEAAGNRIDELTAMVEAPVKSDPDWIAQQERVAQAEATAKAGADKAARSEADRESKGKPYENDPLFMYLWRSGYGTASYRGLPIRRYFDSKVARLVGYDSARANYYMLTEIPLRLRQHAARLAEEANEELTKRTSIERCALEAEGIAALENDLDAAQKSFEEVEARLSRAETELSTLDAEQSTANDEQHDPDYRQALDMLAERLGREDLRALYEKALRTPSPADDRIVQSLALECRTAVSASLWRRRSSSSRARRSTTSNSPTTSLRANASSSIAASALKFSAFCVRSRTTSSVAD